MTSSDEDAGYDD